MFSPANTCVGIRQNTRNKDITEISILRLFLNIDCILSIFLSPFLTKFFKIENFNYY